MSENKKVVEKNRKDLYSFKVQDGSRERVFGLLKPTRRMKQDGDLFYSSSLSKFISAGVLPRALFDKIIKNNGGMVAEPDKEEYADLYLKLVELNQKMSELQAKTDKTEDDKKGLASTQAEIVIIRRQMQQMESEQASIYENTAEAKARNQAILWWFFKTAVEFFDDKSKSEHLIDPSLGFEKNMDRFDEILEGDDEFTKSVCSRLNYLSTVWFLGAASSEEDFIYFDKEYKNRETSEESEEAEESLNLEENEEKKVEDSATVEEASNQEEVAPAE